MGAGNSQGGHLVRARPSWACHRHGGRHAAVFLTSRGTLHFFPALGRDSASLGLLPHPVNSGDNITYSVGCFFFFLRFYLFMRDTERQRHRGSSRLPAGTPTWDSILGPRGHALSRRQMLHR